MHVKFKRISYETHMNGVKTLFFTNPAEGVDCEIGVVGVKGKKKKSFIIKCFTYRLRYTIFFIFIITKIINTIQSYDYLMKPSIIYYSSS